MPAEPTRTQQLELCDPGCSGHHEAPLDRPKGRTVTHGPVHPQPGQPGVHGGECTSAPDRSVERKGVAAVSLTGRAPGGGEGEAPGHPLALSPKSCVGHKHGPWVSWV